jgi:hypothetical protein
MTVVDARVAGLDPSWSDDRLWARKLAADQRRAARLQTPQQRTVTDTIRRRAVDGGAVAMALTGSTARGCRTEVSDLDYHIVGSRPSTADLPGDVDIYAGDEARFWDKLRSGDDLVQWTLRFGCVLFDTGVLRQGLGAIARQALWPDPRSKLARVPELRALAARLIDMGDIDAAQDQVRATLTSAARGLLLDAGVFPLARSELPAQLEGIGQNGLADGLRATICEELSLAALVRCLDILDDGLRCATSRASHAPL